MDDSTAKQIWDIVAPTVTVVLGIVGPALATWVSVRLVGYLNVKSDAERVQMEKQLRDALHLSAENGINYALQKLGIPAINMVNDPNNSAAVISLATSYVKDKNPEAIAKLGVDGAKLQDIVASKIPKAA